MKAVKIKRTFYDGFEKIAEDIFVRQARDRQDDIFIKMSADKKIEIASELWRLGKALDGDKIDFRNGKNRPKTTSGSSRRDS